MCLKYSEINNCEFVCVECNVLRLGILTEISTTFNRYLMLNFGLNENNYEYKFAIDSCINCNKGILMGYNKNKTKKFKLDFLDNILDVEDLKEDFFYFFELELIFLFLKINGKRVEKKNWFLLKVVKVEVNFVTFEWFLFIDNFNIVIKDFNLLKLGKILIQFRGGDKYIIKTF